MGWGCLRGLDSVSPLTYSLTLGSWDPGLGRHEFAIRATCLVGLCSSGRESGAQADCEV